MKSNEEQKSLLDDRVLKIYHDNIGELKRFEIFDLFLRQDDDVIEAIKTISFLYQNYTLFKDEVFNVARNELYNRVLLVFQILDSVFENDFEEKVKIASRCIATLNVADTVLETNSDIESYTTYRSSMMNERTPIDPNGRPLTFHIV